MDKFYRYKGNFFWYCVDLLSCKIDKIAKMYEKYIGSKYKKEIEAFGLKNHKNVLHIGSGSYPISALTLSKNNCVKITGIDRNAFSVNLARKIIEQKKLEEKIEIINSNGFSYPVDSFDLIIVSGCSVPKIPVLEHILKNAKKGSRIIIREGEHTIESARELIDKYPNISILKELKCYPAPTMEWTSFYLEKK